MRDWALRRYDEYYRCTNDFRYRARLPWLVAHWRSHRREAGEAFWGWL